jgi:hypothetical protein
MNFKPLLTAAIFVAGIPAVALAQTTAPVTIESSQAQPQITDATRPEIGSAMVTFVNKNNVPATEVDFTLSSNGEALQTLTDTGTFAPGVAISHTFATDQTARDLQLSVAAVKFADGTTWKNDGPLPQGQRAVHAWMAHPDAN